MAHPGVTKNMALVPPGIDSFRDSESWDDDKSCCNLSAAFVLLIKPCALVLTHGTQFIAGFLKAVAANNPVAALSPYCSLITPCGALAMAMVKVESLTLCLLRANPLLCLFSGSFFLGTARGILCLHLAEGCFCPLLLPASLVPSRTLQNGCRRHKITAFANVYYCLKYVCVVCTRECRCP